MEGGKNMSYYGGFPKYVPVAERKEKAQKSVEKLKKKTPNISPVIIEGKKIAKTWWGEAWNKNLESYSDYSNRIGRGRSYVRSGAVLDLQISKGNITALVQGSGSKPYKVEININPLSKKVWETITKECAGKIASLQELIEGKFPKTLTELFTAQGKGLFPTPKEIKLQCSCPDWANMCKHVAAVLYGVGARMDDNPTLFFELRNINIDELISETISKESNTLLEKSKIKSRRVLDEGDISEMFGIEMEIEKKAKTKAVTKTKVKKTKST
jgi:uncharacterized Zn finger protein